MVPTLSIALAATAEAAASTGESLNPISLEPFKWILYLINLLVIYFVLKKLLWKPVSDYMEKRTNTISESIDSANKKLIEAETLKGEYQAALNNARIEAAKIVEDSRTRGQQEYNSVLEAAMKDSEAFKARTRNEIKQEREEVFAKLKSEIAGLALSAASKVIEANMDTESNRKFVNNIIDKEGVA